MEQYSIDAPQWVVPAIVIGALLAGAVLWNYFRAGSRGWRLVALGLKILGVATLVVCLIEPVGWGRRPRPQANVLSILVDNSQSMRVRNRDAGDSDAERIGRSLDREQGWVKRMEQMFDVRRYTFDARLDRVDDFTALQAEGTASNLHHALHTLADRYRGRAVAGCLLVTDGNATDEVAAAAWSELGFPVYPVRDLDASTIRDLRIGKVTVSQTDFETAPVTIDTSIASVDLPEREVIVRLADAEGNLIEEQTITTPEDETDSAVRFRFRPETAGVSFYRIECALNEEREILDGDGQSEVEATSLNNRRLVAVNQRRGPYEVLYVGGRPNWEFKFMRRALQEDAEVRLVSLLRIAKKQPKFSFGDRTVESSANPLFAGLGGGEEEAAEQLDEPVILRLGVNDAGELAGGFPKESETLFPFSAVILDDIEAEFFTQDQLMLLRQFVSARGGALLILGGEDSLERGQFADTPLAELAPVYLPHTIATGEPVDGPSRPYRMELTREGLLQPFLRLRGTEQAEQRRLEALPPLRVLNTVERVKPGAVVLAVARGASGEAAPALVSQPFGRGKSAALMFGDLWRWSLRRDVEPGSMARDQPDTGAGRDDPAQGWRQIIRWLVSDVARRIEANIEPAAVPGTLRIVSTVRDVNFAPLDGADVRISVETPEGETIELRAEPDLDRAGVYQAEFWPRTPGGYRFDIVATAADGTEIGSTEAGWASDPAADEFKHLGSNRSLLERIAEETGGHVVALDDLDEFAQTLESSPVPVTERWKFPLWHRTWVLIFALGCLCGEWGIRRWKGLP